MSWSESAPTIPGDYFFVARYGDRAGKIDIRSVGWIREAGINGRKDWMGVVSADIGDWGPDGRYSAYHQPGWWQEVVYPSPPEDFKHENI